MTRTILERQLDHFHIPSASVSACADSLRQKGFKVCSFEELTEETARQAPPVLERHATTLKDILDAVVFLHPNYQWTVDEDLVNIYPLHSVLDTRVGSLRVSAKEVGDILEEDLQIEKLGITYFSELAGIGPSINLDLQDVDIRQALNAIVKELGQAIWHISGRPQAYFLSFSGVEGDSPRGMGASEGL